MTKIILVTDYLTMRSGGIRFLIEVLRRLAKKNFEVHVITGSIDYTNLYINNEITITNLNIYDQRFLPSDQPINTMKFIYKSVKITKKIIEKNKNIKYILHLNNHFPNLMPYMVKLNMPVICTIHHLEETYQLQGLIPKIAKFIVQDLLEVNSLCKIIHVPSQYIKNKVMKLSIIHKHNVIVIPPGIEVEKYSAISRKLEENLFIMIGRLEKRKNYEHAIKAFKIASRYKPKLKLVIIGDGPLKPNLIQLIKDLSLEKRVTLLGAVDEQTKLDLLSRAQALIHLGYPEGFGIVIIEALAIGVPIIAYNVPPLNELVKDNVTGILVDKGNTVLLVKAIMNISKYSFSEKVLRNVARKYDINNIATRFVRLYEALAY